MPAVIGLALSFGLIVVSTIQDGLSGQTGGANCNMESENGCTLLTIMGNPKNTITQKIAPAKANENNKNSTGSGGKISITTVRFGEISIDFEGKVGPGSPTTVNTKNGFLGGFGTVIVQFIALIFIWVDFMAAASINK